MQGKTRDEERSAGAYEERKTRDAGTVCGLWNQAQSDPASVSGETLALFFSVRRSVMMGTREEMVSSKTCRWMCYSVILEG